MNDSLASATPAALKSPGIGGRLEGVFLIGVWLTMLGLIYPPLFGQGVLYFPQPDVPEYVYTAEAVAAGVPNLLPVGGELHPSRYAPIHGLLLGLWRWAWGDQGGLLWWPSIALGGAFWMYWSALRLLGLDRVHRSILIAITALSPLTIEVGRDLMSESSLLLLGSTSFLLLMTGIRGLQSVPSPHDLRSSIWPLVGLGAAGLVVGLLVWARATFAPLALLYVLVGGWAVSRGLRLAGAGSIVIGGAIAAAVAVIHNGLLTGYWSLSTYRHWLGSYPLFAWGHPWKLAGPPFEGVPIWKVLLGLHTGGWWCALGWQPRWSTLLAWVVALAGIAAHFFDRVRHPSDASAPLRALVLMAAFVYTIFHILTFSFYEYPLTRFSVLAWPALWLSAFLALGFIEGHVVPQLGARKVWILTVLLLIGLLHPLALGRWLVMNGRLAFSPEHRALRAGKFEERRAHASAGFAVGRWVPDTPLFVDGIGMVRARLLLGLVGDERIVAAMVNRNHLEDGHLPQFYWYDVGPPRRLLRPDAIHWAQRPTETVLLNADSMQPMEAFIGLLAVAEPAFLLYFPSEREASYHALFDALEGKGASRDLLHEEAGWRLVGVQIPTPCANVE